MWGFPGGASGKEPACQCRRPKRHQFTPWVRKIAWKRAQQPIPVFLAGESRVAKSQTRLKQLSMPARTVTVVQSLTRVRLCDPVDCSTSGFPVFSQSLLSLMSIESVMLSTISSSVVLFSSCLQSFPATGSFPMSCFSHQLSKVLELQFQHEKGIKWKGLTFSPSLLL